MNAATNETIEFLGETPRVRLVIVPRHKEQRDLVHRLWPKLCAAGKIVFPSRALNGLDLIWHSDLVISGGGTMNREAAALGVPVYSIFRGPIGAVDRYLAERGRLILVDSVPAVRSKIRPIKRTKPKEPHVHESTALKEIMAALDDWIAHNLS